MASSEGFSLMSQLMPSLRLNELVTKNHESIKAMCQFQNCVKQSALEDTQNICTIVDMLGGRGEEKRKEKKTRTQSNLIIWTCFLHHFNNPNKLSLPGGH